MKARDRVSAAVGLHHECWYGLTDDVKVDCQDADRIQSCVVILAKVTCLGGEIAINNNCYREGGLHLRHI